MCRYAIMSGKLLLWFEIVLAYNSVYDRAKKKKKKNLKLLFSRDCIAIVN